MALPPSLRTSITPPELELVASEHLVEIIPLVSMERTAFISVCSISALLRYVLSITLIFVGCLRTSPTTNEMQSSALDGIESETQEKVPYSPSIMARSRYAVSSTVNLQQLLII